MNNQIVLIVKHVWNVAMHVMHGFLGVFSTQQNTRADMSLRLLLLKSPIVKVPLYILQM